ncbi:PolC-type DNA polymerase III [Cellulophaga sp. Hel_I_12]|uniref:3'-5' exonuclease n=1 Tax=Cellulophaga sp. Hel_I_12 TaxID=1249972 RepID=UPI00064643B7|nr:3'-5' exonuclease [Cellulophaga sp. Hel_I_12]
MFKFFKKNTPILPDFWTLYANTFKTTMPEDLESTTFIVLDTETTGFDYTDDRMLSIGAVAVYQQTIAVNKGFEIYIKQEVYGKEAAKIHGILKHGTIPKVSELDALKMLLSYIGNKTIIAHHAIFDIQMINKALARHHLPALKNKHIDTSQLYKKTLLKSNLITKKEHYSLDELADKFNISKKDRHTAMGDAYITAILFLKILSKLKEKKNLRIKDLLD